MEDFTAADRQPAELCVEQIRNCHLAVFLIEPNYGSREKTSGRSFTEIEYEAAVVTQCPRLVFVTDEDFPVQAGQIQYENREAQEEFRKRALRERVVAIFNSPNDLALKLTLAVRNWENEGRRRDKTLAEAQPSNFGTSSEDLLHLVNAILADLRFHFASGLDKQHRDDLASILIGIERKLKTTFGAQRVKLVPLLFLLAEAWKMLGDTYRTSVLVQEGQQAIKDDYENWGYGYLE